MTVKELRLILADLPDTMEIFMEQRKTLYDYGLVNSAKVKEIGFSEDEDGDIIATDNVLVLDEE